MNVRYIPFILYTFHLLLYIFLFALKVTIINDSLLSLFMPFRLSFRRNMASHVKRLIYIYSTIYNTPLRGVDQVELINESKGFIHYPTASLIIHGSYRQSSSDILLIKRFSVCP